MKWIRLDRVVTPNTFAIALALFTAAIIGFGSAITQEFHCGPADIYLSTDNDGHTIVNFKIKVGKTTRDKQYPVQFRSRYLSTQPPTYMWEGQAKDTRYSGMSGMLTMSNPPGYSETQIVSGDVRRQTWNCNGKRRS
jgi:hypothetical protein